MFERFTTEARQVVTRAQSEAQKLRHRHVGTEHLLLALLHSDAGIPHTVLRDAGVDPQRVRDDIARLVGCQTEVLDDADAAALQSIGIDLGAVRTRIEEVFGPGALDLPPPERRRWLGRGRRNGASGSPLLNPRSKKVLELGLREALHLGHRHFGPEHILLGLVREGNGLAARILTDAGLSLDDLRRQTLAALGRAA